MKCPKCKSNNLLQLGVKATRHSDLVCLDCDWDNMEELLLRKPVFPGIYRSDRDGDFLWFQCPECQREHIGLEAIHQIFECDCGASWLITNQYEWCYEQLRTEEEESIEDVMSSMGVNLAGDGEPYQTMVIEESL